MHRRPSNTKEQEYRRLGRRRRLKLLGFLMTLFLLWSLSTWLGQQETINQHKEELSKVQAEAKEVRDRQIELTEEIKRLQDPEYIGEVARRDYFLSKPGEMIFKIADENEGN